MKLSPVSEKYILSDGDYRIYFKVLHGRITIRNRMHQLEFTFNNSQLDDAEKVIELMSRAIRQARNSSINLPREEQ